MLKLHTNTPVIFKNMLILIFKEEIRIFKKAFYL